MPLAWLGLVALAYLLEGATGSEDGLLWHGARGLAFGAIANVIALRFVPEVVARFTPLPLAAGGLALLLLALAQAIPWALGAMLRSLLVRVGAPRAVAFAVGVYGSLFVPAVFPWTPAGAMAAAPGLLQLADVIGERGVSALWAVSAGIAAEAVRAGVQRAGVARIASRWVLALGVPLALAVHGGIRSRTIEARRERAPAARVSLVDALVPATTRWDPSAAPAILASLAALTAAGERRGAELTVWPESAYPYVLPRGTRVAGPPGEAHLPPREVTRPLLVGAVTRDPQGDQYNAALAVLPDGLVAGEYDKLHLVLFGEEVPFAAELPWLRHTFARGLGVIPGDRAVRLDAGPVKAGVLICFEDTLAAAGRDVGAESPNLLVNLSNDAWFAGSVEPELHLRLSALRAIETRRDLVRAVNFGPSAWIDATGRLRARHDARETGIAGSMVARPALLDAPATFYVRAGDAPGVAAAALFALALFVRTKRNERRDR